MDYTLKKQFSKSSLVSYKSKEVLLSNLSIQSPKDELSPVSNRGLKIDATQWGDNNEINQNQFDCNFDRKLTNSKNIEDLSQENKIQNAR